MYKVALVQNQSEMSHYGYADARPFLVELGYEIQLYTGQNIKELANDISLNRIDALIIASHAMNDKSINSALSHESFKSTLGKALDNGFGCLVLHQLRLGENARDGNADESNLSFLPNSLSKVTPMARPREDAIVESATLGDLTIPSTMSSHFLLHYPNKVNAEAIQSQCFQEGGLQGLYWHYWINTEQNKWDILIEDKTYGNRPLVASAKESLGLRVVISSLTLDWQHQNDLLENLVKYIVEGHQYTALYISNQKPTIGLEYLIERLKSKHFPYKVYSTASEELMMDSIYRGFHSIIVSTNDAYQNIGPENKTMLEKHIRDGKLKLLVMNDANFTVYGRERDTIKLLSELELEIQSELGHGFIDRSFWSTVESLQVLKRLPENTLPINGITLSRVMEEVNKHDMYGSYDEVFGATCALFWLRATVLGVTNEQTEKTASWINERIDQYEPREKILALLNMIQSGYSEVHKALELHKKKIEQILGNIDYRTLSEVNALMYLQAANTIVDISAIKKLSKFLCSSDIQHNGIWVDISTTATAIVELLTSRKHIVGEDEIVRAIDTNLFQAVIAIQKARTQDKLLSLWDTKTSTNLKCIEALLNFEKTIELPVTEMLESLETYMRNSIDVRTLDSSLSVLLSMQKELQKIKRANSSLLSNINQSKERENMIRMKSKIIWAESISICVLLYILVSIIAYYYTQTQMSMVQYFISQLPTHLTFVGVVFAVVFGVNQIVRKKDKQNE